LSRIDFSELFVHFQDRVHQENLLVSFTIKSDHIAILDQTLLPFKKEYIPTRSAEDIAQCIKKMQIRGSGAIGCAGALGAFLAIQQTPANQKQWVELLRPLKKARPTAIILKYAVDEVLQAATNSDQPVQAAAFAANQFIERQLDMEKAIGRYGAELIPDNCTILTHCNSGALAGAGYGGRALSVIRSAAEQGKQLQVIAQETRPYLQGARLTAWELQQLGIPVKLATDGMSGALMRANLIDCCVVGSDRISANGDLANKVGTNLIALAAQAYQVPFYTASTRYNIDPNSPSGDHITIEFRKPEEVLQIGGQPISAPGIGAVYPAFDITPAELISAIITEHGVLRPPYDAALSDLLRQSFSHKHDT
jgi:methylthioribose-1-phosphate isomerase